MHIWISPLEKSVFLAPDWISPVVKSKLAPKLWIYQLGKSIYGTKWERAQGSTFNLWERAQGSTFRFSCIYGFAQWGNPYFFAPVWISQMEKSKRAPKIWVYPPEKSIYACIYAHIIWVIQIFRYMHAYMDFSIGEVQFCCTSLDLSNGEIQTGFKNLDLSLEKSISACAHARIWITRICAYMHAYMDFSDGEIRIFDTSLDFSIGEIQAVTQNMDFSIGEIHICSTRVDFSNGEIQTGVNNLDFSIGEIHI